MTNNEMILDKIIKAASELDFNSLSSNIKPENREETIARIIRSAKSIHSDTLPAHDISVKQFNTANINIYLASPLGFCPEHDGYREKIKKHLIAQDHTIFDPWNQSEVSERIAQAINDEHNQAAEIKSAATFAGLTNADAIRACDVFWRYLMVPKLTAGQQRSQASALDWARCVMAYEQTSETQAICPDCP